MRQTPSILGRYRCRSALTDLTVRYIGDVLHAGLPAANYKLLLALESVLFRTRFLTWLATILLTVLALMLQPLSVALYWRCFGALQRSFEGAAM
jgi:hypothetical protein